MWAGLCGNGTIIGPFFFDVNINGQTYLNVINEEIVPQMQMHFQFDVLGDVVSGFMVVPGRRGLPSTCWRHREAHSTFWSKRCCTWAAS